MMKLQPMLMMVLAAQYSMLNGDSTQAGEPTTTRQTTTTSEPIMTTRSTVEPNPGTTVLPTVIDKDSCRTFNIDIGGMMQVIQKISKEIDSRVNHYERTRHFSAATHVSGRRLISGTRKMTFSSAMNFCFNRNALMVEPDSDNINDLQTAVPKDDQGNGHEVWIDVVKHDTLNFATYRGRTKVLGTFNGSFHMPPMSIPDGHCVSFNLQTYFFDTKPCDDLLQVLCQERESIERQLFNRLLIHDLKLDRIFKLTLNSLANIPFFKKNLTTLFLTSNENCHVNASSSLSQQLELLQPMTRMTQLSRPNLFSYILFLTDKVLEDLNLLLKMLKDPAHIGNQITHSTGQIFEGITKTGKICTCPLSKSLIKSKVIDFDFSTFGTVDLKSVVYLIFTIVFTSILTIMAVVQCCYIVRDRSKRPYNLEVRTRPAEDGTEDDTRYVSLISTQNNEQAPLAPPRSRGSRAHSSLRPPGTPTRVNLPPEAISPASEALSAGQSVHLSFYPGRQSAISSSSSEGLQRTPQPSRKKSRRSKSRTSSMWDMSMV